MDKTVTPEVDSVTSSAKSIRLSKNKILTPSYNKEHKVHEQD